MISKPVRKYAQPKYPTRLEIAARPALLHRHQPPAWRKWPELTGAAGLFLLADTARLSAADTPPAGGQTRADAKGVAVVAPIFQHGEGRGATGCIVMAPPIFLSEEEALRVIREEMATQGVNLGTNQTTLAGITVEGFRIVVTPASAGATNRTKPASPAFEIKQDPFKTDVADPNKKVFVEFLGERDAWQWDRERGKEEGNWQMSTVRSYDLPKTAAYLAKRVKRQATDKVYFGTFYDPIAATMDMQKAAAQSTPGKPKSTAQLNQLARQMQADARAESRRLLRLQVQDFLKWLQAQGAI